MRFVTPCSIVYLFYYLLLNITILELFRDNFLTTLMSIFHHLSYTLQQVPEVNVTWNGQSATPLSSIDISVAVATDGGLITPIVKSADAKGLMEISANVRVKKMFQNVKVLMSFKTLSMFMKSLKTHLFLFAFIFPLFL